MILKKEIGRHGEDCAVEHLQKNGYQIVARNWRYLKGEIDIIAKMEGWLIFVEVKTRSTKVFGNPEEFVSMSQQKLIINTAHEFIVSNNRQEEARFDIISILLNEGRVHKLDHITGAFYPTI